MVFPVVFRVAQFCLLAQIILAPLLLGGERPWAMGILSVLTGIGILALCAKMPICLPRYLRVIWLMAGLASGWMVMQSLPIWPTQAAPFNADHIALYAGILACAQRPPQLYQTGLPHGGMCRRPSGRACRTGSNQWLEHNILVCQNRPYWRLDRKPCQP